MQNFKKVQKFMKKPRYIWSSFKLRRNLKTHFSTNSESDQMSPSLLGNLNKFMDLSLKNKLIDTQGTPNRPSNPF